jgi:hypothetical protein
MSLSARNARAFSWLEWEGKDRHHQRSSRELIPKITEQLIVELYRSIGSGLDARPAPLFRCF